jgi:hypothetical protein
MALFAMAGPSSANTTTRKTTRRSTHPTASSSQTAKHKVSKGKTSKSRRARRSYQQTPTPERYKEIQQALAGKGYFHGEPNGEWGSDSQDALKRFQADQSLTTDGKLTSMSLIALGLGPKRLSNQSHAQPPAPEPPKPEVHQ